MKQFILILTTVVLFACQPNPQKQAEKAQMEAQKKAEKQANEAQDMANAAGDKAQDAMMNSARAAYSEAISEVSVPNFGNNVAANELTKKLGNEAVKYVNSKDSDAAQKYANQIKNTMAELDKLVSNGKIDQATADQIKQYAQNLTDAVQINVEVEIDTIPQQ